MVSPTREERQSSTGGAEPALLGDIENDPVRVLELALEILLLGIIAQVEEEGAARCFDALLRGCEIIDLEAEMMGADEALGGRPVPSRACRSN